MGEPKAVEWRMLRDVLIDFRRDDDDGRMRISVDCDLYDDNVSPFASAVPPETERQLLDLFGGPYLAALREVAEAAAALNNYEGDILDGGGLREALDRLDRIEATP